MNRDCPCTHSFSKLVLADEPTGNLDSKASQDVMEILIQLNKEEKTAMMLVTYDPVAASYCDRVIFIKDGQLYHEICYNDNRPLFYQNIMDSLSMLGENKMTFRQLAFNNVTRNKTNISWPFLVAHLR